MGWYPEPCNKCKHSSDRECHVYGGNVYHSIDYCMSENFENFEKSEFWVNVDSADKAKVKGAKD